MARPKPIRVAIVGGGCAGVTAAFELSRPEHKGRYEVTLYQTGFRLGGKGASGRGASGRIEEHGLHLWMGFYENAFRLVRDCYAELARDPKQCPIAAWTDAFRPDHYCGVAERTKDDRWLHWKVRMPPTAGLPGDPFDAGAPRWSVVHYMGRAMELLRTMLQGAVERTAEPPDALQAFLEEHRPADLSNRVARLIAYGGLGTLTSLLEGIRLLQYIVKSLPVYPEELALRLLEGIATAIRVELERQFRKADELRRVGEIVSLILATVRGILTDRLFLDARGFDAIDHLDFRVWLQRNGASEGALGSAFLRVLYDIGFAYADGQPDRPVMSAGQALRDAVRAFFTYRGAFFWKMQAGMGDVLFAPLYEVLKRRGVRFEFFHRLENVCLGSTAQLAAGDQPFVEALEFDVQAKIKRQRQYEPLIEVGGLPCWPATPDFDQLEAGAALRRERRQFESDWDDRRVGTRKLIRGKDFDLVVLSIGLGAVHRTCREISDYDSRWRSMLDHVKTVPTQAFQVWLDADLETLGWRDEPINLCGFTEPFDTWADMGQLITHEAWKRKPKALAYFCSVLADEVDPEVRTRAAFPGEQQALVKRNAIRFLNRDIAQLWPKAHLASGKFRWNLLTDLDARRAKKARGEARFDSQYWTANINASDRYVQSVPGSARFRISPLDSGLENLVVAGDWTNCGFNQGCVEAAVISGRLAAHAISLSPRLEDIIGFDHP